jgi:hypothetical protein
MKSHTTPVTTWLRPILWAGTLALVALTQVGCAYYPYPPGVVYVREPGYRHMPTPAWGYRGHGGHGDRGGRW